MDDSSYILFKSYARKHQAEMDLNKLKSEGIDAYVTDGTMGSFGFFGVATGGVKLHVAKEDFERAREILSNE